MEEEVGMCGNVWRRSGGRFLEGSSVERLSVLVTVLAILKSCAKQNGPAINPRYPASTLFQRHSHYHPTE